MTPKGTQPWILLSLVSLIILFGIVFNIILGGQFYKVAYMVILPERFPSYL
jgi:uncharacterized membrane protein